MSEQPVRHGVIFRIPTIAMIAVGVLFVCVTPVAFGAPGLQLIYLLPAVLVLWVIRTRTVVDADTVVTRTVFGRRGIPWTEVVSLRLTRRSGVRLVLADDSEVALPAVWVRDLPALAKASGGRIPDPSAATDTETEVAADTEAEPAAEAGAEPAEPTSGQARQPAE